MEIVDIVATMTSTELQVLIDVLEELHRDKERNIPQKLSSDELLKFIDGLIKLKDLVSSTDVYVIRPQQKT